MSDLEGMINGILSNPEEMKKIMDMAGKIMGEGGASPEVSEGSPAGGAASIDDILSGLNPGDLGALGNLGSLASAAQSLLGSGTVQKLLNSSFVQNLTSEALRPNNDKKELFNALKPWLSEKRQAKLEKAIVFAKVMRVAGAATPFLRGGRE